MTQAFVEELLARPFPDGEIAGEEDGRLIASGPGYHVAVLAASEAFWDDSDGERARAAAVAMEARRAELAAALSATWGPPVKVRFWPSPRPLGVELLNTWSVDGGEIWVRDGRVVCVGISQVDKEFEIELIAAIGAGERP